MINGLPRIIVVFILTIFMAGGLAYAQAASPPAEVQSTQGKTIFDFKAELKLTDKQEKEIREILAELNRDLQLNRAKLTILSFELEDLTQKEGNLEQMKKNLKDQADLQSSMRYADIVATRKINKVLSSEQLKKWRSIQASAR